MCCSVLQCVAVSCRQFATPVADNQVVVQRAAVCCSVLQCIAVSCSVYEAGGVTSVTCELLNCYNVVQRVAVSCIVLQCVAVRCSVYVVGGITCKHTHIHTHTHTEAAAGDIQRVPGGGNCAAPHSRRASQVCMYVHTYVPMRIPHPRNPPDRKTQISLYVFKAD